MQMIIINTKGAFWDSNNEQREYFKTFNIFLIWVNNLTYKNKILKDLAGY